MSTWMNLENIMLTEKSGTEEHINVLGIFHSTPHAPRSSSPLLSAPALYGPYICLPVPAVSRTSKVN